MTRNRHLDAWQPFFDALLAPKQLWGNAVNPRHGARLGRPWPGALWWQQVQARFVQLPHPMDNALCVVRLRRGFGVSEGVPCKLPHRDWEQRALRIAPGTGCKDRLVSLPADAVVLPTSGLKRAAE